MEIQGTQLAFEAAAVAFEMLIVHLYLGIFAKARPSALPRLMTYAVFGAALLLLPHLFPNMYLQLALTFAGVFSVSALWFDGAWQNHFFAAVMFCFLAVVTETASSGIVSRLAGERWEAVVEYGNLRVISNILANTVWFVLLKIIGAFVKRSGRPVRDRLREYVPLLPSLILSIFVVIGCLQEAIASAGHLSVASIAEIIAILYVNIIAFWYYERTQQMTRQKVERDALELQTGGMVKYYDLVKRQREQMTALRHDVGKHLAVMERLAAESREASQYLEEYKASLARLDAVVHTPNPVVSVILSDCVARALEIGVKPELTVEIPAEPGVDAADLTVILGNTIDNALRALERLPPGADRRLSILLRRNERFLMYEITNTCGAEPKARGGRVGYGLKNVRGSAQKYHGDVSAESRGDAYSVSVLLQMDG